MSEYPPVIGFDPAPARLAISETTPSAVDIGLPATDYLSSTFLLGNVGAPFAIGLAVGYFAKKVLKLALFLAGAAFVLLFVTEYYGLTDVSDAQLQHAANSATNMARDSGSFLIDRLSHITSKGVSAAGGFFVGLKFG